MTLELMILSKDHYNIFLIIIMDNSDIGIQSHYSYVAMRDNPNDVYYYILFEVAKMYITLFVKLGKC